MMMDDDNKNKFKKMSCSDTALMFIHRAPLCDTCNSNLKEFYVMFSSSLNRLLSQMNIVPITNIFQKYHMIKHYRTCVK